MVNKRERQGHILEVLARNRIDSQEQLLDLLAAEGVHTAQSTLSRDLRDMGVVKSADGYRPPRRGPVGTTGLLSVVSEHGARVRSVDAGGGIVVFRTDRPEDAAALAPRLEASTLPRAVAAVATDRTVLVVMRSAADANDIVRQWKRATGRP